MRLELRISLRLRRDRPVVPHETREPEFEHRDTESLVEQGPGPIFPLGFQPQEE